MVIRSHPAEGLEVDAAHEVTEPNQEAQPRFNRRRLLVYGLGGTAVIVAAGALGIELISHGVLPGKLELDELDGACSVSSTTLTFATPGPSIVVYSHARNQTVGYTIGYPPEYRPGLSLPLIVMLHGRAKTTPALRPPEPMSPAEAMAIMSTG